MKNRPKGFLSAKHIDQHSDIFDYISELHGYLWQFVHVVYPGAGGSLGSYVDSALFDVRKLEEKKERAQLEALEARDHLQRMCNLFYEALPDGVAEQYSAFEAASKIAFADKKGG